MKADQEMAVQNSPIQEETNKPKSDMSEIVQTEEINKSKEELKTDSQSRDVCEENQKEVSIGSTEDPTASKDAVYSTKLSDSVETMPSGGQNAQQDKNSVLAVCALLYTNSVLNTFYIALEVTWTCH